MNMPASFKEEMLAGLESASCKVCRRAYVHDYFDVFVCPECCAKVNSLVELKESERYMNTFDRVKAIRSSLKHLKKAWKRRRAK